jgi:hypothetical protein
MVREQSHATWRYPGATGARALPFGVTPSYILGKLARATIAARKKGHRESAMRAG